MVRVVCPRIEPGSELRVPAPGFLNLWGGTETWLPPRRIHTFIYMQNCSTFLGFQISEAHPQTPSCPLSSDPNSLLRLREFYSPCAAEKTWVGEMRPVPEFTQSLAVELDSDPGLQKANPMLSPTHVWLGLPSLLPSGLGMSCGPSMAARSPWYHCPLSSTCAQQLGHGQQRPLCPVTCPVRGHISPRLTRDPQHPGWPTPCQRGSQSTRLHPPPTAAVCWPPPSPVPTERAPTSSQNTRHTASRE